ARPPRLDRQGRARPRHVPASRARSAAPRRPHGPRDSGPDRAVGRGAPPPAPPARRRLTAMDAATLAARAKTLAREAGFDLAGVARADGAPDLSAFARWVSRGYAGEMGYLTSQVAK